MRRELPTGTVTFLFTDIEGSTRLLGELGEAYGPAVARHRRVLRDAVARHGGAEVDTQGDAFFAAFADAGDAVQAAAEIQEALAEGPMRVRMGLHTGRPRLTDEGYVGADVHLGARIAAAGHGGQVLLSKETRDFIADGHAGEPEDLMDLGEHRLKDFVTPISIFQLGSASFPPLRTISNTNLPRPASSFVGREREITEIAALLRDRTRLLTLTGPGGSGKTRLAIEAASELVPQFKAGVFWVGLAALRDPGLVSETIGQTLGAKDGLAEHIGEREMLLLVDNLEQVVGAAAELAALVEACPNLRVLSTSRELLRVRGEVEYAVTPLADPEAVELFCDRANTRPDETVRELCRALDNLPLALELAAARASVLSPNEILQRLSGRLDVLKGGRDADPRQQTLRATIEWSYALLSPDEQRLFARLAVFRGGCTLEAAEQVARADLDILQSLVDKSLVRHADERFSMLETIREYAADRFQAAGEAEEVRRLHADYFLGLAEEAEPHLRSEVLGSAAQWLHRLEVEHDNLRAALDRLEALGETQLALRLAGAVWWFWDARSHLVEGQRRLEGALRADTRPTPARARALNGAGMIAIDAGDLESARLWSGEALPLHRAFGDAWGSAYSGHLLGWATLDLGHFQEARPLNEESVRLFRELGDQHHSLFAAHILAWNRYRLGDLDGARTLWEANLRSARAAGNRNIEALSLGALADNFAVEEGRIEDALSMMTEAYRIHRDLGAPAAQTAMDLARLARVLALAGRGTAAAQVLASAQALYEQAGARTRPLTAERDERTLSAIQAQLPDPVLAEAWEQGRKLTADEAVALALGEAG